MLLRKYYIGRVVIRRAHRMTSRSKALEPQKQMPAWETGIWPDVSEKISEGMHATIVARKSP